MTVEEIREAYQRELREIREGFEARFREITESYETPVTRIRDKISALLAKTRANGCTEGEALAAAELAFKLVVKYGLKQTFPSVREPEIRKPQIPKRQILKSEIVTRPMLSKARRAYRKADASVQVTPELCRLFCEKLIDAGIDPLSHTSYRLSKYIQGEIKDLQNL
jgi:hypothetical protein